MEALVKAKPKRKTAPVYVSTTWDDFLRRLAAEEFLKTGQRTEARDLVERALAKVYGVPKGSAKRAARGE